MCLGRYTLLLLAFLEQKSKYDNTQAEHLYFKHFLLIELCTTYISQFEEADSNIINTLLNVPKSERAYGRPVFRINYMKLCTHNCSTIISLDQNGEHVVNTLHSLFYYTFM